VRYFRLAAKQGDAAAQCHLAYSFESGEGVAQDQAEAVRYFRLAAEQGDADAQFSLGDCFENGEGVAQDWSEAVRYYRLAAAQTGALSAEQLAVITTACDRIACSHEAAASCCLGCGARRNLKKCTHCRIARFCSSECLSRAWPAHKPNCKLWREVAGDS
jgi:hypothetical protein